jgi:hypothetical protein
MSQPKPKAPKKPVQYAKFAKVGDVVHSKGNNVSSFSQLKRWFGSQADAHWFTGTLEEIYHTTVGKTKTVLYEVRYALPDGSVKLVRGKNILHRPGAWINPDPAPAASILGGGHTRVPASSQASGRRAQAPLFAATDDSSADTMLDRAYAQALERIRAPTVPASAAAAASGRIRLPTAASGRRKQASMFDDTDDDTSVDTMLERIYARSKATGLKTVEPPTDDDDSTVDNVPGATDIAPPRLINQCNRSTKKNDRAVC